MENFNVHYQAITRKSFCSIQAINIFCVLEIEINFKSSFDKKRHLSLFCMIINNLYAISVV